MGYAPTMLSLWMLSNTNWVVDALPPLDRPTQSCWPFMVLSIVCDAIQRTWTQRQKFLHSSIAMCRNWLAKKKILSRALARSLWSSGGFSWARVTPCRVGFQKIGQWVTGSAQMDLMKNYGVLLIHNNFCSIILMFGSSFLCLKRNLTILGRSVES